MKNFIWLILILISISACVPDEERTLQTNQAFEAEEIFLVSRHLSENVFFAYHPFSFYLDTLVTAELPDCPEITISESDQEVVLDFNRSVCNEQPTRRRGKIILSFTKSDIGNDLVELTYDGFSMSGTNIQGRRIIEIITADLNNKVLKEQSEELLVINDKDFSTKINISFQYEIITDTHKLIEIQNTGTAEGRNWAGRKFQMQVLQPKINRQVCLEKNVFTPGSGEESWEIERTGKAPVTHRLTYSREQDCSITATILLSEGIRITKNP